MRWPESSLKTKPDKVRWSLPFSLFLLHLLRLLIALGSGNLLMSEDTGGSLGWKIRGSLDAAFEKAAYDLEPSTAGNPKYIEVKTGFGYHVIMVEGRK